MNRIKILRKRAPADGRDGDGLLTEMEMFTLLPLFENLIYVALSTAACEMSCSRLCWWNLFNFEHDE